MELMPHIKAFLDDLVSITSNILVKRQDVASSYENSSKNLQVYNYYKNIVNGIQNNYDVIPTDILAKIIKWELIGTNTNDVSISPSVDLSKHIGDRTIEFKDPNSGVTTYLSLFRPSDSESEDDLKYTKDDMYIFNNTGRAAESCQYTKKIIKTTDSSLNLITDDNELIDTGGTIDTISAEYSTINLYLRDNSTNVAQKYVPISLEVHSEYVSVNDLVDAGLIEFNSSENVYKIIQGELDRNEIELSDDHIQLYYWDSSYADYCMTDYDSTIVDNLVAKRIIYVYKYLDSTYYNDEFIYIETNSDETEIDNYELVDNTMYYKGKSTEYDLYISTTDYDNIKDSFDEYTNPWDITKTYFKYVCIDQSLAGKVSLNRTYGDGRYIFDHDSDKVSLYYSYDNALSITKIYISDVISEITESKYYTYKYNDITYTEIAPSVFYTTDSNNNYIHHYGYEIDSYEEDTIYKLILDNVEIYRCGQLLADWEIAYYSNNPSAMLKSELNRAIPLMDAFIVSIYAPEKYSPSTEKYSVQIYDGEQNPYYRVLNGLPASTDISTSIKVDRSIYNSTYPQYSMEYVCYLTDSEVNKMQEVGDLDKLKKEYPDSEYLQYLGINRVDVITAREAVSYGIMRHGTYKNTYSYEIFQKCYSAAREYILRRHTQQEMFNTNEYYGSYVGLAIISHALEMCMAKSGVILTDKLYNDYETVQLRLASYGFESTFNSIPLVYRARIAKYLDQLIEYKGINALYEIIYKIFDVNILDSYEYWLKHVHETEDGEYKIDDDGNYVYDLSILQSIIDSENLSRELNEVNNIISYDDITNADVHWGSYRTQSIEPVITKSDDYYKVPDTLNEIKNALIKERFNYIKTKYITLNNKFDISALTFKSSYLLNYILETSYFLRKINFETQLTDQHSLYIFIITLFAIQSKKYKFTSIMKYDDYISNELTGYDVLIKFNLDGDNSYDIKTKIREYIDTALSNRTLTEEEISDLRKMQTYLESNKPIIVPAQYSSNNINDIATSYLANLKNGDNYLDDNNPSSFFVFVKNHLDNTKNYDLYLCYSRIYKLIATSKTYQYIYKLENPEWVNLGECDDETWTYKYFKFDYCWNYVKLMQGDQTDESKANDIVTECRSLLGEVTVENIYNFYNNHVKIFKDGNIGYAETINKSGSPYRFGFILNNYTASEVGLPYIASDGTAVGIDNDKLKNSLIGSENPITTYEVPYDSDNNKFISIDSLGTAMWNTRDPSKVISFPDGVIVNDVAYLTNSNSFMVGTVSIDTFKGYLDQNPSEDIKFYMQIVLENSEDIDNVEPAIIKKSLYYLTSYAFTYDQYLKTKAPEIYNIIDDSDVDESNRKLYIENLDNLYSTIIVAIDEEIQKIEKSDDTSLLYNNYSNILPYIRLVVEVFKSYTVDIAKMEAIYLMQDKSINNIKLLDSISAYHETFVKDEKFNIYEIVSLKEHYENNERFQIKDEIIFLN